MFGRFFLMNPIMKFLGVILFTLRPIHITFWATIIGICWYLKKGIPMYTAIGAALVFFRDLLYFKFVYTLCWTQNCGLPP